MKPTTIALASAALLYVVSWFVPVVNEGATLAEGAVPGWEAFRTALSPIWPYQGLKGDSTLSGVIGVVSALTNFWFVLSSVVLALLPLRSKRGVFWGLVLAALVNATWLLLIEDRGDVRIGYYLWLGSFFALAAAARLTPPVPPGPVRFPQQPNIGVHPTAGAPRSG